MRIICCYRWLNNLTRESLERYAPEVELIKTEDPQDLPNAIRDRWNGEEDLVIVEQDKEITAEVIPSFQACDQFRCAYSYYINPDPYTREVDIGLGCTRFSAEVQQIVPATEWYEMKDLWAWGYCPDCDGKGCWRFLDSRINVVMLNHNIIPHCHGRVKHHHWYPAAWGEMYNVDHRVIDHVGDFQIEVKTLMKSKEQVDELLNGPGVVQLDNSKIRIVEGVLRVYEDDDLGPETERVFTIA